MRKNYFTSVTLQVFLAVAAFSSAAAAQRIAVIAPENSPHSDRYAEAVSEHLSTSVKVLDRSLSEAAFRSVEFADTFNLSTAEAKRIGAVIGCDYFLLIRTGNLRRTSYERPEYYEAFAAVYLVSSRTGKLVFWKLNSFEADTTAHADKLLFDSPGGMTTEITDKLAANKVDANVRPDMEEAPDADSSIAKDFRAPMPYKRIKPEYTRIAYLFGVRATVDIEVDIGITGEVMRAEIVRWAGFGLDESVTDAIRKMNWRPAMRKDKPLPMRVLLRYNFVKIEKE